MITYFDFSQDLRLVNNMHSLRGEVLFARFLRREHIQEEYAAIYSHIIVKKKTRAMEKMQDRFQMICQNAGD